MEIVTPGSIWKLMETETTSFIYTDAFSTVTDEMETAADIQGS